MASNLSLLRSFIDGQGAGASTYLTYDADFDYNFTAIESAFNTLNAEFRAFGGANASLVYDLAQTATIVTGFIGAGSFLATFTGGNTQLSIAKGEAMTASGRIAVSGTTVLTGSGASGTRYAALSVAGVITLQTSAVTGALDLYSVNWNGASFDIAGILRLPGTGANNILVDADDFQAARVQENISQGTSAVLGVFTYDRIADRIHDIVRLLAGKTTSVASASGQATLKPIAIGGTTALPALILTDGTSTFDTSTGLFRQAANALGVSVQGTEAARWVGGSSQPQQLLRAGTALATPPLGYIGDPDNGFGYVSSDRHRAIAGSLSAMEWSASGGVADVAVPGTMTGAGANRWGNLPEALKTTNYTVIATDRGGALVANSASALTFSLTAAATLGAGFTCAVRNINTGVLTVDPSGAELVAGLSTLILLQGQSAVLTCTGTEWRALLPDRFSALPEVIKTADYTVVGTDLGTVLVANNATALAFNLTAAATIGAGFTCHLKNIGAGRATVDPSGAELVNNGATLTLKQGEGALLWCTGTEWRALQMRDSYREVLTANRTYYVRTDGSDSNTGLVDSAGGAFLTKQAAVNTCYTVDQNGFTITIQVRDGTYAGGVTISKPFSGLVTIVGNVATPANVLLTSAGNTFAVTKPGVAVTLGGGFKFTGSNVSIVAGDLASVTVSGAMEYGALTSYAFSASGGAAIQITASYSISGNAGVHWYVNRGGRLTCVNLTITLTGTPAFGVFASASVLGLMTVYNITFSGAATGTRYASVNNAMIETAGGGATYLPGDVAGYTSGGGIYN